MAEPTDSADFFKDVRQGHVFSADDPEKGHQLFAVISQTCDIVLPKRPTVSLARVVKFEGSERAEAATRKNPRYVPLPSLGENHFVDFCFIGSWSKDELVGLEFTPGINLADEQAKRDFSLSITRWFGRFPFPDEVVPWLQPLESIVREKYRRNSALGQLLRDVVVEIRVEEARQWRERPYSLEVHTIVRAEALPTLPDDLPVVADDFIKRLRDPDAGVKQPGSLADLFKETTDGQERSHLLHALAESFAALCQPAARYSGDLAVTSAVSVVEWQLWADDDFPLARVRKSEPLDLEFLSDPETGS
jgi:hypothetical protein